MPLQFRPCTDNRTQAEEGRSRVGSTERNDLQAKIDFPGRESCVSHRMKSKTSSERAEKAAEQRRNDGRTREMMEGRPSPESKGASLVGRETTTRFSPPEN